MSDHAKSSGAPRATPGAPARYGWAVVPIPLLLLTIVALWIADLRTPYESRALMVLLNVVFTWLVSLCICILTARGFLASGQPALLMFGCGSLVWGATSLAAAVIVDRVNPTITVHNVGVLAAAFCHVAGLLWLGRLARPVRWLVAGYAAVLMAAVLLFWAAMAEWTPLFFVQGRGGAPVRQTVLLLAVVLFAWVAWQLFSRFRRHAGDFYYWYGLGLALTATGLTGVFLLTVQGGILGWTNRLTQYLGCAYLFVAAMAAARETGGWTLSLEAVEEAWRKGEFLPTLRREPSRWLALRYGFAVVAVAAGWGLRQTVTAWVGAGLPPFLLFYPTVMVVALLGGFGPGALATVVTGVVVGYWIMPPAGSFGIASPVDRVALALFSGMGLLMSAVAELYRRYRHKAAAYEREAAASRIQRTFAELVERSPFGTYIVDSQFRIAMMNASSQDGAFRNVRPVIGRDFAEAMRILWPEPVAAEITGHFRHTLDTGEPYFSRDFVNPRRDAEIVEAYEWELHRMTLPDGQHGVICYYYDSTKLREAERALRASEERFRIAQELLPDGFSILKPVRDPAGRVADFTWVYANAATERSVGMTLPALAGRSLLELFSGHAGSPFFEAYRQVAETGHTRIVESLYHGDGVLAHRWFRIAVVSMGQDIAVLSQDITERKQAEAALRESEEKYRVLFESIDQGFCTIEVLFDENQTPVDFRFLMVNPAFERQTGIQNAVGRRMREIAPLHEEHWFQVYGKIALTGEPRHFEETAGELHRDYDVFAWRIGAPAERKVAVLFHDITERKQAEQALERTYGRLKTFFDRRIGGIGVVVARADGSIVQANDYYLDILGHTRAEFEAGQVTWSERTPAEWLPADERALAQLSERGACDPYEKEYARRDGTRVPVLITDVMMPGPEKDILAIVVNMTERKRAEESLRASEEKYRHLFENIEEMVTVYEIERDDNGQIVERRLREANRTFLRAVGVSSIDRIRGKTSSQVFGKVWSEVHLPAVQKAMDTGQVQVQEVYHPDSGRHYITSVVPLDAQTYLGTGWDITAIKKAEEALRAANQELEEFNRAMVGRELRMIELKQEVNAACAQLGQSPRYQIEEEQVQL